MKTLKFLMDVRGEHSTQVTAEAWFGFLVPNGANIFKHLTLKFLWEFGRRHLQMLEDKGGCWRIPQMTLKPLMSFHHVGCC